MMKWLINRALDRKRSVKTTMSIAPTVSRQNGFTLIELLVALAIFIITAGALALAVTRLSERAHRVKTNAAAQEQAREIGRWLANDLYLLHAKNGWQRPLANGPLPFLLLAPNAANCSLNAYVAADGTGTNALYCSVGGPATFEASFEFDPAASGSVRLRPSSTKNTQLCLTLNSTSYDQTNAQYGICLQTGTNQLTAINNGTPSQIATSFQPGASLALELDYSTGVRSLRLVMLTASGTVTLATLPAPALAGNNARPVISIQSPAQNSIQLDSAIATGGPLRPLLTDLIPGQSLIVNAQNMLVNNLSASLDPLNNPQWVLLLPDTTAFYVASSQIPSPDSLALTLNAAPPWNPGDLVTLADPNDNISLWSVQSIQNQNVSLARVRSLSQACPVRDSGPSLATPPTNNSTLRAAQCVVYQLEQTTIYRQDRLNKRPIATGIAKVELRQVDYGNQTLQAKTLTTQTYTPNLSWQLAVTPAGDDQPFLIPLDLPNSTAPNRNPFGN